MRLFTNTMVPFFRSRKRAVAGSTNTFISGGDRRLFFTVARAVAADAPALVDAALTVAR